MKIYLLYENRNGKFDMLRDAYITEDQAKEHAKPIGESYSSVMVDGNWKMVEDTYKYTIKEIDADNPTFDVYVDSGKGRRISGLTFDDAELKFHELSKVNCVELQIPLKQFGSYGVTKIKTNKDAEYWEQHETQEERNWSPSTPWNAPGMSIRDFI